MSRPATLIAPQPSSSKQSTVFDAQSFRGQVVLVTGGSAGIGEGCCRAFCAAGATVVICARSAKTGEALAKEMNDKNPGSCRFMACDVSSVAEVEALVASIATEYGRIDCVVNNAGWHPPDQSIDDVAIDDFVSLLQLNLVSIFAFCKYALPHLRKTGGSIINMSSLVGSMGQSMACSYVTTKSAITGLTKALAVDEARHGVRVNSVSPAAILTPLAQGIMDLTRDPAQEKSLVESWHHLKRFGTIDEVGAVCVFLASDAASFLTGVDIPVSGGAELGYGNKFSAHQPAFASVEK